MKIIINVKSLSRKKVIHQEEVEKLEMKYMEIKKPI